jgi:hypothetical protein
MFIRNRIILYIQFLLLLTISPGCDRGLEPPIDEPDPTGVIVGTVTYSGEWPPENELIELFFVPLPFIPSSVFDILSQFENLRTSETLQHNVDEDEFIVEEVPNGAYIYNIIANQYGNNPFTDWRPLGIYSEDDGVIIVSGDTTVISIHVDFDNLPPFPPEP